MGHQDIPQGPEGKQSRAMERLLTSFYDTGVADASLYTGTLLDFRVPWGYPVLAKIGLGIVLLIIAIVASLVYCSAGQAPPTWSDR
jgi:hypothetical protein